MFTECLLLLLAASFVSAGLVISPENRIIGGRDIRIEDAPWQVLIIAENSPVCGGSILSKNIIITAAHCLHRPRTNILLEAKDFLVLVGSEHRDSRDTLVKVAATKPHKKFTFSFPGRVHDIGIMKLSKPLEFSNKIKPIPLATKEPAAGSPALSTGWGLADRDNPGYLGNLDYPKILQAVQIPIKDFELCKESIWWLPKNTICAGAEGQSACRGDSGGPLVVNGKLVGILSGGTECFNTGMYASVVHSHDWILKTIKAI